MNKVLRISREKKTFKGCLVIGNKSFLTQEEKWNAIWMRVMIIEEVQKIWFI
jgi:hypothetical protein